MAVSAPASIENGCLAVKIALFRSSSSSTSAVPSATAAELLAALLSENGDAQAAVGVLDEAIAAESEMHAELVDLRARIMVSEGMSEDLQFSLTREMDTSPHMADWTYESLMGTVGDLADEGETIIAAVTPLVAPMTASC